MMNFLYDQLSNLQPALYLPYLIDRQKLDEVFQFIFNNI